MKSTKSVLLLVYVSVVSRVVSQSLPWPDSWPRPAGWNPEPEPSAYPEYPPNFHHTTDYTPNPTPKPKTTPETEPTGHTYSPGPTSNPTPKPKTTPEPEPGGPTYSPGPTPNPTPKPKTTPEPEPSGPTYSPGPTSNPTPKPTTTPEPEPRPTCTPKPEPTGKPEPRPTSTLEPIPTTACVCPTVTPPTGSGGSNDSGDEKKGGQTWVKLKRNPCKFEANTINIYRSCYVMETPLKNSKCSPRDGDSCVDVGRDGNLFRGKCQTKVISSQRYVRCESKKPCPSIPTEVKVFECNCEPL